jgi:hypothetical protein
MKPLTWSIADDTHPQRREIARSIDLHRRDLHVADDVGPQIANARAANLVGFLGSIFALLGCLQEGVVAAAQMPSSKRMIINRREATAAVPDLESCSGRRRPGENAALVRD